MFHGLGTHNHFTVFVLYLSLTRSTLFLLFESQKQMLLFSGVSSSHTRNVFLILKAKYPLFLSSNSLIFSQIFFIKFPQNLFLYVCQIPIFCFAINNYKAPSSYLFPSFAPFSFSLPPWFLVQDFLLGFPLFSIVFCHESFNSHHLSCPNLMKHCQIHLNTIQFHITKKIFIQKLQYLKT